MESEDFRLVSALQESARRFKDKNAVYSALFPIVQVVHNIKMMLSLQVIILSLNFD